MNKNVEEHLLVTTWTSSMPDFCLEWHLIGGNAAETTLARSLKRRKFDPSSPHVRRNRRKKNRRDTCPKIEFDGAGGEIEEDREQEETAKWR